MADCRCLGQENWDKTEVVLQRVRPSGTLQTRGSWCLCICVRVVISLQNLLVVLHNVVFYLTLEQG